MPTKRLLPSSQAATPSGMPGSVDVEAVVPMPPGVSNIYLFEIFNTISWTVILSTPMLLFLKHLNANATLLSLACSLSPVLNLLQLPAAHFVEKVGYKRFVLSGWTARSFLVIGMAIIAFLPDSVDRTTRITFFFVLILFYNTLRGFSVCGMLPWFTHLVPESRRGEFLAKDQFSGALATILSTLGYAFLLTGKNNWYGFGVLFSVSAASAFYSLTFLHRTPDVPVEAIPKNPNPMPWMEMLLYQPFFRYITYNLIINFALGTAAVFWVPLFRDSLHVTESGVMLTSCATSAILAGGLYFFGSLIDRAGNKPMLLLSAVFLGLHFVGWAVISAKVIPFTQLTLAWQCFTSGIGTALWNLANVRMVIGIIPVMGRAHFLALYSVISNVTYGIAPLILAPAMDCLQDWTHPMGYWTWNCYSVLYLFLGAVIILGIIFLNRIHEPGSMTWDNFFKEVFFHTPTRGMSRLIGRWRGTGWG